MVEAPFQVLDQAWEITTLGEVARRGGGNVQTGPFGSQLHASDYVADGVPSIMPQNIGDNRIIEDGIARIRECDAARLSKYRLAAGDIVYSRRGDVERRSLVRSANEGWLCGTGCLRVRFGKHHVFPEYAAQYLGHPAVREWIVQHAVGATMPNLNTGILSAVPFVLPPMAVQVDIASVLSALDDKIELNRRMNETLEGMAQAIFRDWFVDFGPVRRKMAGATDPVAIMGSLISDPTRAAELAALFPDALGDDDLPVGWKLDRLGSLTELQNGYAFKSSDWCEDGVPVIKIGSVKPGFVDLSTASFVSPSLAEERASFRLLAGDMVVGLTGYVGETGRVPNAVPLPLLNQRVARFKPRQEMSATVYTAVRDDSFKVFAVSKSHGSAQPNVSTKDLLNYPIVSGGGLVFAEFERLVAPLFAKSLASQQECATLAEARDYLLPRLMSGEVRVDDAALEIAA